MKQDANKLHQPSTPSFSKLYDQYALIELSPNNRCSTQFTTLINLNAMYPTITPTQPEIPPDFNNAAIDYLYDPNQDIHDFNFDDTTYNKATDINPTSLVSTFSEPVTILQSKIHIQNTIIKHISTRIRKLEDGSEEYLVNPDNLSSNMEK